MKMNKLSLYRLLASFNKYINHCHIKSNCSRVAFEHESNFTGSEHTFVQGVRSIFKPVLGRRTLNIVRGEHKGDGADNGLLTLTSVSPLGWSIGGKRGARRARQASRKVTAKNNGRKLVANQSCWVGCSPFQYFFAHLAAQYNFIKKSIGKKDEPCKNIISSSADTKAWSPHCTILGVGAGGRYKHLERCIERGKNLLLSSYSLPQFETKVYLI